MGHEAIWGGNRQIIEFVEETQAQEGVLEMADNADHRWDMKDVGPGEIRVRVEELCRS